MRKDMSKVIVERERVGGKYNKSRRKNNTPYDELPKREGMKKAHTNLKSLNENLKPLFRFFQSKIGHKWDKVFSEVCENIKLDSAVQKHVRDHIQDLVRLNVEKREDKKVYTAGTRYHGKFRELTNKELYVDPDTGILKEYKLKEKKESRKWDYGLSDLLKLFKDDKSTLVVEDGVVYKMFYDKFTKTFSNKVKATKVHAKNDTSGLIFYRLGRIDLDLLIKNNMIDLKDEYWAAFYETYKEAKKKEEKALKAKKKQNVIQPGTVVEYKYSKDESWTEAVVVEVKESLKEPISYTLQTVENKKSVWLHGYVSYSIRKKA